MNAQLERIKSDVEARHQARDVQRTQRRAEWAEQDAAAAIAVASFAIQQAEYAVLDATLARYEADAADGRRRRGEYLCATRRGVPDRALPGRRYR